MQILDSTKDSTSEEEKELIKEKLEFLAFEKTKETERNKKLRSDQELLELKKFYASLDKEQKMIDRKVL